jgi:hypothetical protein
LTGTALAVGAVLFLATRAYDRRTTVLEAEATATVAATETADAGNPTTTASDRPATPTAYQTRVAVRETASPTIAVSTGLPTPTVASTPRIPPVQLPRRP